jgi:hypothetical protein
MFFVQLPRLPFNGVRVVWCRVFLDCDGDGLENTVIGADQSTSVTSADGKADFSFISEAYYYDTIETCDFTFDAAIFNQANCVNAGTNSPSKVRLRCGDPLHRSASPPRKC